MPCILDSLRTKWLVVSALVAFGPAFAAEPPASAAPSAAAEDLPAWGTALLRKPPEWYGSAEARAVALNVLRFQSAEGGWPKNTNLSKWPPAGKDANYTSDGRANTFDNRATTAPMEFLARVHASTGERAFRDAFDRGLAYTLAAQYANGGWPQFYPLREGYYSHVTFNDDAMALILTLLREVAAGRAPYGFVDAERRQRAADAVTRGIDVILRTQIRQGDRLTVWCAQHDEKTLEPAWARAYEPPSLSGSESVGVLRFLMSIEKPTPQIIAAVEGGARWLRSARLSGTRVENFIAEDGKPDKRSVPDPDAEPIWARFYELGTNEAIFLGRDSVAHTSFNEIERERRNGYAYFGTWPRALVDEEYPAWRKRLGLAADPEKK